MLSQHHCNRTPPTLTRIDKRLTLPDIDSINSLRLGAQLLIDKRLPLPDIDSISMTERSRTTSLLSNTCGKEFLE